MKLDLRSALVVLMAVALGYVICLTMPVVQAEENDPVDIDSLKLSELRVDRLVATESIRSAGTIGFTDGPDLEGFDDLLFIKGTVFLHNTDRICYNLHLNALYTQGFIVVHDQVVIDSARHLQNVVIDPGVQGGAGLDVGKLEGHPKEDFILRSEIDDEFCQIFCPIGIKSKPSD